MFNETCANALVATKCEEVNYFDVSERCGFVKNLSDCQNADGFLNYINIEFCDFNDSIIQPMILYTLLISFLFVVIGVTTNSFFCPALSVISKMFGVSDTTAGVTFLALGNGAPDIFSSLAAVSQDRPEFVIGGLFGAGMFVTCVVAGSIMIVTPFEIESLPFLRDIIFYMSASFWAFFVFYRQQVRLLDALGFIGLYFVYIFIVIGVPKIYKVLGRPCGSLETNRGRDPTRTSSGSLDPSDPQSVVVQNTETSGSSDESTALLPASRHSQSQSIHLNKTSEFLRAASPIDCRKFMASPWYIRAFLILKSPAVLFLRLTIPVIDYDIEKHNWNRTLNALHCVIGPLFLTFANKIAFFKINVFPLWAVVLITLSMFAATVYLVTTDETPPRYHFLFALLGFAISIIWIYSVANEIVNILKAIGVALNIPGAILGLTVLAWGNSIGDFVANFAISRKGFPLMGMSACFGGPLLNLLVGMGLPFTYLTLTSSTFVQVTYDKTVETMSIFLFVSLACTLVAVVVVKFKVNGRYGAFLLILYVVFAVITVLKTLNVI